MSDRTAEAVLYILLLVLPLAGLIARRPPLKRTLLLAVTWVGIFLVGLLLVGQRDRLRPLWSRHQVEGRETRITVAADGHFWANVTIDGVTRRMLMESGASTTAISQATAETAGLSADSPFPIVLETANGRITATTAPARRVSVGELVTQDLPVAMSARFHGTDVLGMNFLSRLGAWRAEGRTLVLTPKND